MRIFVDCYGDLGQVFLSGLTASVDFNELTVKTYDVSENQSLIYFLKSKNISHRTLSYSEYDYNRLPGYDAVISVFGREKIPEALYIKSKITFNYHPSLLPNYQGCFSVPWALICGETKTGYTLHQLTPEFDKGDIIMQRQVDIDWLDTSFSLYAKIKSAMVQDMETHFGFVRNPSAVKYNQQPHEGEYFGRELPYRGFINVNWPIEKVDKFIRAMIFPLFEPAKVLVDGEAVSIYNIGQYKKLMKI